MRLVRVRAIMRKEVQHIRRDPRSLIIIFAMPAMMIVLYGYALNMDVKNIALAVLDRDQTARSREVVETFVASRYFTVVGRPATRPGAEALIRDRTARAVLVIPHGFARDLGRPGGARLQVLVDGSDAVTATVVLNYADLLVAAYALAGAEGGTGAARAAALPVRAEPRVWYNPDLRSANFLVPGLMATILMMICALLTSITIAREKETGTMEQILVSPVRPWEIMVGKVVPYIAIAFLDGVLVLLVGKFWFGIPIRGSVPQLLALSTVYLFAALSIGLLISTVVSTQIQAMLAAQLATTLPSLILSGFIYPIGSMPAALRVLSYVVPARYFITIARGITLKGLPATAFGPQVAFLLAFGLVLVAISTRKFRARLG